MAKKNRKAGGLGAYLNKYSKIESQQENNNTLVRIDIDKIKSNPGNFYGLRDIDKLAEQINRSHIVEPLMVTKNPTFEEDGKEYLLIAGHRRRAAWEKLLESGKVTDRTLPCVIHQFEPIVLKKEDGTETVISVERVANMYLMYSNMGQRDIRTVSERLEEIDQLQPIARDIYESQPVGSRGNFRTFFATDFLRVSESYLQRILAMKNLSERAREYVDEGKVAFVFGSMLSSLSEDEQDSYLDEIDNGIRKGTVRELMEYKKSLKDNDEGGETENTEEEEEDSGEAMEPSDTQEDIKEPSEPAEDEELEEPDEPEGDDTEEDSSPVPADDEPSEITDNNEESHKVSEPASEVSHHSIEESVVEIHVEELPENINDPEFDGRAEATLWFLKAEIANAEKVRDYAQAKAEAFEDVDEAACGQWTLRKGEAISRLAMLRQQLAKK